jgi:hypothetical protein
MKSLFPIVAFAEISLYAALLLAILAYTIAIRLIPMKVKFPMVAGIIDKVRFWMR